MGGMLFSKVLHMSLIGCYSMLIVLLARCFLKKIGRKYSYYLWLIVFINLCIPFSIFSSFSLIPERVMNFSVESVDISEAAEENASKNLNGQAGVVSLPQNEALSKGQKIPLYNGKVKNELKYQKAGLNLKGILPLAEKIWLFGIGLFALYSICAAIQLNRRIAGAYKKELSQKERIVVLKGFDSPFLWGILHPTIYLPENMEPEERGYIIAHEKCHRKRRDYLIKILIYGVTILHWFNPLVWVAYRLCCKDMEISCDESVLEHSKENIQKAYAESLLRYAMKQNHYIITPLTFGEPSVRSRIINVLQYRKRGVILSAFALLITIFVAIGLFMRPKEQEDDNSTENTVSQTAENYRNMTYGEYKESTGNDVEFYHGNYFIGEIPESPICVVYSGEYDEDLAGAVLQDSDIPIRLQGTLADLVNGIDDKMTLGELTELLSADSATAAECELLEGAGTAYYVGNEYAQIRFDSDRDGSCDMTLDVSLDESGTETIYPENIAWLSFENSGEQQTPEENIMATYSDSEIISDYSSNPMPGLPCGNPMEAGWNLESAIDIRETFTEMSYVPEPGTEENVYLIGKTEHYTLYGKGDFMSMLLECNGRYSEIDYPYTSNYMTPLELLEADFDGDDSKELAIKFNIKHGTGLYIDTFLLADFQNDGNLYVWQFLEDDMNAQLMEYLSYEKTADGMQALVDEQPAGYFLKNDEERTPWRNVSEGAQLHFYYRENTVELSAEILFWEEDETSVMYETNGSDITANVLWNGAGEFALTDFRSRNRYLDEQVEAALKEYYGTNEISVTNIRYDSSKMNEDSLEVSAVILPKDGDSYDYASITMKRTEDAYVFSAWNVEEILLEK